MYNYEVFLLINDDEVCLGTVEEILDITAVTAFATLFADMVSNMTFGLEDQTTQTFKIELRSPDGL